MPRKPRADARTYGDGVCIDCRRRTPRTLPERFPHICWTCLFGEIADALWTPIVGDRTRHAREHSRARSTASQ